MYRIQNRRAPGDPLNSDWIVQGMHEWLCFLEQNHECFELGRGVCVGRCRLNDLNVSREIANREVFGKSYLRPPKDFCFISVVM